VLRASLRRAIHNVFIQIPLDPRAPLMGLHVTTFQPIVSNQKSITSILEGRDRLYQHPDCQSENNFRFL